MLGLFALPAFLLGPIQSAAPPPVSDLQPDEQVLFFPTLGARTPDGASWELQVHGWVFEPSDARLRVAALRALLGDAADDDGPTKTRFEDRARMLFSDSERGKRITIRIGDRTWALPPSTGNGHFKGSVRVSSEWVQTLSRAQGESGERVRYRAVLPAGDARVFEGIVLLSEPTGVSVISDIDDTIKITEVHDTRRMLRNTFLHPFRPVPGMADVYRAWKRDANVRFHYVSASPWHLYPSLAEWLRAERFPAGTFHLKEFRFRDETLLSLFASPENHKRTMLESLLRRFPQRRFVLVGDSSEKDPEIYADLARRFPEQVLRILIRRVETESAESDRFREIFRGLPDELWKVFDEPEQIRGALPARTKPRP